MITVKEIITVLVARKELMDQYGWQSCLDVPEQYDKMDYYFDQAKKMADQITANMPDTTTDALLEVCQTIADEIRNGNIDQDRLECSLYTQDEYLETRITDQMDAESERLFESLFYWMDSGDRAKWLKANYINNDPYEYTDLFCAFVLYAGDQ